MIDRYTKTILTVIAVALLYLAVVLTPFPSVSAQGTLRPGEPSGPLEVVVVGWKSTTPMSIVSQQPLRVVTERPVGRWTVSGNWHRGRSDGSSRP